MADRLPANKYYPGLQGGVVLSAEARITTGDRPGSTVEIPADHAYGESVEQRYRSLKTGQYQAYFVQVEGQGGAASTVRGGEWVARQHSATAIGTMAGIHAQAQVRGTGNAAVARGVDAQISVFSGYSGTLALAAALYGKFQTEGTITEGYGALVENEAVTGGVTLRAALGVKATAGLTAFERLIDARGVRLAVAAANIVALIRFRDTDGNDRELRVDNAGSITAPTV